MFLVTIDWNYCQNIVRITVILVTGEGKKALIINLKEGSYKEFRRLKFLKLVKDSSYMKVSFSRLWNLIRRIGQGFLR